jgi:hypothetical protein
VGHSLGEMHGEVTKRRKKEKGLVRMDVCTWNYFRLQTWDVASFWTTCVDLSMSQSGQSIHVVFGDVFVGGSQSKWPILCSQVTSQGFTLVLFTSKSSSQILLVLQ